MRHTDDSCVGAPSSESRLRTDSSARGSGRGRVLRLVNHRDRRAVDQTSPQGGDTLTRVAACDGRDRTRIGPGKGAGDQGLIVRASARRIETDDADGPLPNPLAPQPGTKAVSPGSGRTGRCLNLRPGCKEPRSPSSTSTATGLDGQPVVGSRAPGGGTAGGPFRPRHAPQARTVGEARRAARRRSYRRDARARHRPHLPSYRICG